MPIEVLESGKFLTLPKHFLYSVSDRTSGHGASPKALEATPASTTRESPARAQEPVSKNAKEIRIEILNPARGCQSSTSLEHARRYVRKGTAEWNGGKLFFLHGRESQPQKPTIGRIVSRIVEQYSGQDSGFNLLPYPQASAVTGEKYRVLSMAGAGL